MKLRIWKLFVVISLLLMVSLACSSSGSGNMAVPEGSETKAEIPTYSNSKQIILDDDDLENLVSDYLGYRFNNYLSRTELSWTNDVSIDVIDFLDDKLPEKKWRLQNDWSYGSYYSESQWKRGDLELVILVFDSLESETIRDLRRKYGVDGPESGSTLILTHVIDVAQESNDLK